jgi:alkylation response protein AidB-like acyl-CoA dehydrogenase
MAQLHTEPERRFIGLAAELATEFAARAGRYDEQEKFPYENYGRLRESGYSILTIREELGGLGATVLERVKAQERLAEGCGATVLLEPLPLY